MSSCRHGLPTGSQELLLKAALLDGAAALTCWSQWREVDSVTQTDHDSGRLLPLLCRNLLSLAPNDPELWVLKSAYRHQWLANQHRMAAAGRALHVLAQAGVETMVLKGAALAYRYYRDLGVRPMYDVDILVRPAQARAAGQALLDSGWTQFPSADFDQLLAVAHGAAFHDHTDTGIDLHWYAMWAPAVDDDFWSAAEPIEVGGAPTVALCPADQLLHTCVHGIWSDGHRVRWVADSLTVLGSQAELAWGRVIDCARARAVTLPLRDALKYLRDQFGAEVPTTVLASLDRTRRGVLERAGHRAWQAPPSKVRLAWLLLERYRRQRPLPPGPAREESLWRYLRSYATVALELDAGARLTPALVRALLPKPI